ncbi:diacylglycerol kinase family protein [Pelagibacteraceae bacterium]|jgi:diacylglycerol kinase (ATP)|nr:diacylglycerol kinase family protein [Pelagibacteraceae bacterium]MDC1158225.1 diacylglycerol kinase family protein [Pelagibacteraceae bacterium]
MNKNLNFALVFNSNAAGGRKLKLINKVISILEKEHTVELFKTQSEEHATEVFKRLSAKTFDRLIVAGGDGSVCFAINEMIKNQSLNGKLVGYIPTGTTNILQIETQIKKRAKEICQILVSDKHKKINLARINDKYFFLMAGIGFDSEIVASIDTNIKKYLGKIIFALKGFQHFLFLKKNKMQVEVDNKKIMADWILCTNSKYYAGPHSITNETNIFEKKIVAYIFRDLTRLKLIYYVWLILTKGDLTPAKSVIKIDLDKITISGINKKLLFQVDGENCGYNKQLEIQKTNKFINLLVP